MTTATGAKHLELTVSNIGPIAEASIELRPLSVFVGPSNTGKSYLATLIYALHQFCGIYAGSADHRFALGRRLASRAHPTMPPESLALSENDITGIVAWAGKSFPDTETRNHPGNSPYELPDNIAMLVRPFLNEVARLNQILDDETARCFGVDSAENLVSYHSNSGGKFSLCSNIANTTGGNSTAKYEAKIAGQGISIEASISEAMPLQIGKDVRLPWHFRDYLLWTEADGERDYAARSFLGAIASAVASGILGPLSRPAHYLPADRAGVMHAHQVAVRGLIAGASRVALRRDVPMPVLSGVLGDFLEQLVALADLPHRERGRHDDLALRLEQKLMRGAIRVERSEINYPSFVYRPEGWRRDLPLMNTSSMVSELAPVVLYLRHVVQPGDTLIIEEPESHLHPAMQVEFTRLLAAAVPAGIRIIVTTHSEWVLEELANLVSISELPAERRGGLEDADISLRPDEVGAWFFEPGPNAGGATVREIKLDQETGTFPSGFGLITESLYNRWAEIFNRIEMD